MSDLSAPDQPTTISTAVGTSSPTPAWQSQDGVLREMWLKNHTPQSIAEALGRSVPAVMTRAARLGLPRRSAPGRKAGVRRLDNIGATGGATARPMLRTSASTSTTQSLPQTSPRVCLMCLNKFDSSGRNNRICSTCKGSSEYESASSLSELHMPGT